MKRTEDNKLYIVDENGIIIDKIDSNDDYVKISAGDRILRKNSLVHLKDTIALKYHFVKVNPRALKKYCQRYAILTTLISHVGYMDNIIEFDNGRRVTTKSIHQLCEVSKSTIKRQLSGLIADDIVHKIKDEKNFYFMLNPYLCHRGKRILKSTFEEFKHTTLKEEIEE